MDYIEICSQPKQPKPVEVEAGGTAAITEGSRWRDGDGDVAEVRKVDPERGVAVVYGGRPHRIWWDFENFCALYSPLKPAEIEVGSQWQNGEGGQQCVVKAYDSCGVVCRHEGEPEDWFGDESEFREYHSHIVTPEKDLSNVPDGAKIVGFDGEVVTKGAAHSPDGFRILVDSNKDMHSVNGLPAAVETGVHRGWYEHGKLHREEGAAMEGDNGTLVYCLHNKTVTPEEWAREILTNPEYDETAVLPEYQPLIEAAKGEAEPLAPINTMEMLERIFAADDFELAFAPERGAYFDHAVAHNGELACVYEDGSYQTLAVTSSLLDYEWMPYAGRVRVKRGAENQGEAASMTEEEIDRMSAANFKANEGAKGEAAEEEPAASEEPESIERITQEGLEYAAKMKPRPASEEPEPEYPLSLLDLHEKRSERVDFIMEGDETHRYRFDAFNGNFICYSKHSKYCNPSCIKIGDKAKYSRARYRISDKWDLFGKEAADA